MIEQINTDIEILDIDESENYGKFALYPLERGYATTIGNSLRRVLLSSLPGFAVSKIKIDGVLHEFSVLKGVLEDVPQIILNLKGLAVKNEGDENVTMYLDVKGPKKVTASDITSNGNITIANEDHYIATVNEKGKLYIEMQVVEGKGYNIAELNKQETDSIGEIAIDSSFTPVKKVNFIIENTRVGHITDYDKLIIEVWTNGTITPQEALKKGSEILIKDFSFFNKLPEMQFPPEKEVEVDEVTVDEGRQVLQKTIEELDLTLRSFNCLKRAGFNTVEDIVKNSEAELKKIKNFGKKSLDEVKAKVESLGLEIQAE